MASDVTEMTAGTLWLADANGSHVRDCALRLLDQPRRPGSPVAELVPRQLDRDGSRPLYEFRPIRVVDVRSGHLQELGEGVDPSWLDDHALIIADFKEIGCDAGSSTEGEP